MSEPKYQPPEDEIERFLKATSSDPRTMAVAYLRARKRARDAEMAFRLLDDIQKAQDKWMSGDSKGALSEMEAAKRRLHGHNDYSSS